MLTIFKKYNPLVLILVLFIAIILWVGTIINNSGDINQPIENNFSILYQPLANFFTQYHFVSVLLGLLILILQALLIVFLNSKYIFIQNRTYLPALYYLLISVSFIPLQQLHPVLIANIFFILCLYKILVISKARYLFSNYFEGSFLLATGSLFYYKFIYIYPLVWAVMLTIKTINWREWIVSLLGFILPFLVLFFYFFMTDNIQTLVNNFISGMTFSAEFPKLTVYYYLFYGFIVFILLIALLFFYSSYYSIKINFRKYFSAFAFMCLFIGLVILLNRFNLELLPVIAVPISYFISNLLINLRNNVVTEAIFLITLFLITLIQLNFYFTVSVF